MCGILVYTGTNVSEKEFKVSFEKIIHRGPDDSRIISDEKGVWGFHRLSIMDLSDKGMQPFELNGSRVVCNGEIYNFRKLKEELESEYTFTSESDCEVLLPLFEKYNTDMFNMLDAEFALVMYIKDEGKFIAARDSIGIRGMFYGYERESKQIMFSSEAKAITDLCDEVHPFPPGHYYMDGEFKPYHIAHKPSTFISGTSDDVTTGIKDRLVQGVLKRLDSDAPIGYLLSGGLDSSLICAIASKHMKKPIKTFSIGMEKDPIDLKYAKVVADYLNSDHTEIKISKKQVIETLRELIYLLETWDITTIRASVGMYLVCKYIRENTDIKVLLTGEISDELFGYKYTDYAPSAEEFQKEAQKRIKEIHMYDVLRADRCISSCSLESRVPFGDLEFVDYVMSIDPKLKMNTYGKGKYLLRKAFEGDYLPNSILYREKAAFSDAVGHSLVDYLKEYAEEKYSNEEFNRFKNKYNYCTPISKESLLYREIFEEFYNGKAELIKDYWMPNKEWEGCNVNDPSARVLSNYGDSGETYDDITLTNKPYKKENKEKNIIRKETVYA